MEPMEEEISLRELIEVLLKRKWLIAGITAGAVVAAAVISYFVLPEEYTATAAVKINPPITIEVSEIPPTFSQTNNGLVVVQRRQAAEGLLEIPPAENATIIVTQSPKIISLVDKPTFEFIQSELQSPGFLSKVSEQLGGEVSPAALRGMISLSREDKSDIITITTRAGSGARAAMAANLVAEMLPQHLGEAMAEEMKTGEDSLLAQINEVGKMLTETTTGLSEAPSAQRSLLLQARAERLQEFYTGLVHKYEDMRIFQSMAKMSETVSIVSRAVEPQSPASPRSELNVAIALVLGLMASVFLAFFWEYWTSTAPGKEARTDA